MNNTSNINISKKSKGGRPSVALRKEKRLSLSCTSEQKKLIEQNANMVRLSVSEYLLKMGLTGKIDRKDLSLPADFFKLMGTLNHMAANLNQLAKKNNQLQNFNALERAASKVLIDEIHEFLTLSKNYFK